MSSTGASRSVPLREVHSITETETLVETAPAITIALNDEVSLDLTTLIETRLLVQTTAAASPLPCAGCWSNRTGRCSTW